MTGRSGLNGIAVNWEGLDRVNPRGRRARRPSTLAWTSRPDSANIGGIVACNAGGTRALRYGTAPARVAGLEVVLSNVTILRRMHGLEKDNAGSDLASLAVGTWLGVVVDRSSCLLRPS